MAFQFFNSFPPEIHSLILSSCSPNDRTCLSLTCKYLYELNPLKKAISLSSEDKCLRLCPKDAANAPYFSSYLHLPECHESSFAEATRRHEQLGLAPPKPRKCRTRRWERHCQCFFTRSKLYQRLRTWVPQGLNYCRRCDKFTRRKKSHNGRCYHGRGKTRCQEPRYWTHRPRQGAFGWKLWKKWMTNTHMNLFEKRLRMQRDRAGTERYSMRTLAPKQVDTRTSRYCHGFNNEWQ